MRREELYHAFIKMRDIDFKGREDLFFGDDSYTLTRIIEARSVVYGIKFFKPYSSIFYNQVVKATSFGFREEGAILKLLLDFEFFKSDLKRVQSRLKFFDPTQCIHNALKRLAKGERYSVTPDHFTIHFEPLRDKVSIELVGYSVLCWVYPDLSEQSLTEAFKDLSENLI